MFIGKLYKSWERVLSDCDLKWIKYTDGTKDPKPENGEIKIKLKKNEIIPPVYSAEKGAIWKKIK